MTQPSQQQIPPRDPGPRAYYFGGTAALPHHNHDSHLVLFAYSSHMHFSQHKIVQSDDTTVAANGYNGLSSSLGW